VALAISQPATDTNSSSGCDCDCDCDQGRDATTSWWSWTLFVTRTTIGVGLESVLKGTDEWNLNTYTAPHR